MCHYRSAEAVYDNGRVVVYASPGEDSHTANRIRHGISESGPQHTPVEYIPTQSLDMKTWIGWILIWDAGRPTWGTDEVEREIVRQMHDVILRDDFSDWVGSLDLSSVTSISEGASFNVGGYLDLSSVTAIPEGTSFKVGGSLYLRSVTAIPEGASFDVGGYLDLSSVTSIPEGTSFKVGGYLDLSSVTSIPEGLKIEAKRIMLKGD